jgi:hypothetical protein
MKKEDITLLEVVWYETFNEETKGSNCGRTSFTKLL